MPDDFMDSLYAGDTAANRVIQAKVEINNIFSKLENALSAYFKSSIALNFRTPTSTSIKHILNAFTASNENKLDINDTFDEVIAIEPSTQCKSAPLFLYKKTLDGWPIYIRHNINTIRITSKDEFERVLNDILREPSTIFKLRSLIADIANANKKEVLGSDEIDNHNNGDQVSQAE